MENSTVSVPIHVGGGDWLGEDARSLTPRESHASVNRPPRSSVSLLFNVFVFSLTDMQ